MMLLALKFWKEGVIALLVVVLMAACHARDNALKAEGIAVERYRVADSTLKVVTPKLAHVDTLLVHDTVKVRRLVTSVETLHDTVLAHLTDTVRVKEFITKADSAAKACVELSNDCQAFRAFATQKIAALESKLSVAPPTTSRRWGSLVLSFALGAGAGYLAHR